VLEALVALEAELPLDDRAEVERYCAAAGYL
jgi:hypothetical protein